MQDKHRTKTRNNLGEDTLIFFKEQETSLVSKTRGSRLEMFEGLTSKEDEEEGGTSFLVTTKSWSFFTWHLFSLHLLSSSSCVTCCSFLTILCRMNSAVYSRDASASVSCYFSMLFQVFCLLFRRRDPIDWEASVELDKLSFLTPILLFVAQTLANLDSLSNFSLFINTIYSILIFDFATVYKYSKENLVSHQYFICYVQG